MIRIPSYIFKIAERLIEEQLLPQTTEPADLPATEQPMGNSVLSLLGKEDRVTAKEPAPKIVRVTARQANK